MPEAKSKGVEKVEVEFLKEYCAARGESIIGAKGAVKTYPMTKQLAELMDADREGGAVLKLVRKVPAAKREKAAGKPASAE